MFFKVFTYFVKLQIRKKKYLICPRLSWNYSFFLTSSHGFIFLLCILTIVIYTSLFSWFSFLPFAPRIMNVHLTATCDSHLMSAFAWFLIHSLEVLDLPWNVKIFINFLKATTVQLEGWQQDNEYLNENWLKCSLTGPTLVGLQGLRALRENIKILKTFSMKIVKFEWKFKFLCI